MAALSAATPPETRNRLVNTHDVSKKSEKPHGEREPENGGRKAIFKECPSGISRVIVCHYVCAGGISLRDPFSARLSGSNRHSQRDLLADVALPSNRVAVFHPWPVDAGIRLVTAGTDPRGVLLDS